MAVEDPSLDCAAFRPKDYKCPRPGCKGPEHCSITAEATDPTVRRLVAGYTRYKALGNSDAPHELRMAALTACGATELLPDLVLELDDIHYEMVKIQREKAEKEYEHKQKQKEAIKRRKELARKM